MSKTGIIYEISFENGKSYIGQTTNFKNRKMSHKWYANNSEKPLYRAMKKYKYDWNILEEVQIDLLDEKEQYYISLKDTFTSGYNLNIGGKQVIKSKSYTYDDFYNSAIKYKTKKEWRESADKYLCNSCRKNYKEIYKKVTSHMTSPININKHTDSYIIEVASRYEFLNDFRKEQNTLYTIAHRRGMLTNLNLKRKRKLKKGEVLWQ